MSASILVTPVRVRSSLLRVSIMRGLAALLLPFPRTSPMSTMGDDPEPYDVRQVATVMSLVCAF